MKRTAAVVRTNAMPTNPPSVNSATTANPFHGVVRSTSRRATGGESIPRPEIAAPRNPNSAAGIPIIRYHVEPSVMNRRATLSSASANSISART